MGSHHIFQKGVFFEVCEAPQACCNLTKSLYYNFAYFLYDIAKSLHDKKSMLYVGGGPAGKDPLIFQRNGTPLRGFLEGRVRDGSYLLVLHLSNLELMKVPE